MNKKSTTKLTDASPTTPEKHCKAQEALGGVPLLGVLHRYEVNGVPIISQRRSNGEWATRMDHETLEKRKLKYRLFRILSPLQSVFWSVFESLLLKIGYAPRHTWNVRIQPNLLSAE